MLTTMSSMAVIEAVAVTVSGEPLFSAMEDAEEVSVIFGTSSSIRLKVRLVVEPAVASAPDKVPNDTITVSAPSETLSSVGVIVDEPVVAPAEIVISLIVA
jgi:hypothetical protein